MLIYGRREVPPTILTRQETRTIMSELQTIYSPTGEKFEVTRPNFKDLLRHAGWSASPIAVATPEVSPVIAEAPVVEAAKTDASEPAVESEAETETPSENAVEKGPRLTVEDFADLEDKAAVVAYISETYPDAKVDLRGNREKMIEVAIALAAPAAE